MGKDILTKVRKLNWMLQESGSGVFSFNDFCGILSDLMDANVYITNKRGKVIGVHYKIKSDSPTITDPETGIEKFPNEYNDALLRVVETEANLRAEEALEIFKYDYDTYDKLHTIIPIISGGHRLGTLILTRYNPEFTDEDLVLGEYSATVVDLEIPAPSALPCFVPGCEMPRREPPGHPPGGSPSERGQETPSRQGGTPSIDLPAGAAGRSQRIPTESRRQRTSPTSTRNSLL